MGHYDVETPDGVRIEIKASAYWQSWPQRQRSKVIFSGLAARSWQADLTYREEREVRADVYVLAVQACADATAYDPLDVAQWEFYVLPADVIRNADVRSCGTGLSH